ncbi:uncharacterized protein LOC117342758 [Pecten maximus]|uniref:uncharacterized protein LOC117342758 n=1 Tax=Pecten maximus TaxID=6579 RepID=UPI00145884E7|nr:uncharacterized protein LOC117342758 [Pecten maximus]
MKVVTLSLLLRQIRDVLQKQPIHTTCSSHNEKRDCYCEDHGFLGCNKCIITDHRRCDAVTSAKEYCEKQKESSRLDDMGKSLKKAFDCMELMVKSIDDKGDAMRQCQEINLSSISDVRQRINSYLDKKQEEITQDLISKYKAEKAKIDVSRQKCSRLRAAIQNTREASRTAARIDDHIGMIQLFHRGQTELLAYSDLIDDISSSKSVSIKHNIDPSLDTIDQTSPLTLGTIFVEEHPCTIPDGVDYVENHTMLSNSRVRKLRKFTIKVPSDESLCNVHGVLLMSNGDIIVSDFQNDHLKLFSCQGRCLDVLKINGYPHDVCLVDDSTVAVAVSRGQIGIHVMKVHDSVLTLLTVIKMPEECYGVTFKDGKFMVSTPKDIYRVGMEGESEKVDQLPKDCYNLASCPNEKRTLASMRTSKTGDVVVTKLSTGVQTCVMRVGLVKDARGIDVDRQRNLYVCGYESNNVVQMSTCGTRIRELLTSQDSIDKPRAISVCGDRFVVHYVSNESPQDRNNIHVYQLY